MIKTIKIKKDFTFRELMEYIIQNDVSGRFESSNGRSIKVHDDGTFLFDAYNYGDVETYEIKIEIEITEDTKFEFVVINTEDFVYSFRHNSIKECRDKVPKVIEIFARIDGRLQKIWECE